MEEKYQPSTATLGLGLASTSNTSTNYNPCPLDQVSTALTLCDPSWNYTTNKTKTEELDPALALDKHGKLQPSMSTKVEDRWPIKKRLTESDIGSVSCRLLVPKRPVETHVLPYLHHKLAKMVKSGDGIEVQVQDWDTKSMHQLTFNYWGSTRSYILNGDWVKMFVNRRELKENDEIGLYWDTSKSMFMFSVLGRANQ